MSYLSFSLALLALAGPAFIAVLLVDGIRTLLARHRREAAARPLELIVTERHEATDQLVRLTLARTNGGHLPTFVAGQHLLLQAPAGRNGKTLQRAYSLAAWTSKPRQYELGIKRENQGAVSGWVWENLSVGKPVSLLPPKGDFFLEPQEAGELVLIGGGIGITPMRAMLHAAIAGNKRQRVALFHAARRSAELLYHDEFQALTGANDNFSYHPFASRPDANWTGETGRLDATRIAAALEAPMQATFYLCAGAALMDALRTGLLASGVDKTKIHYEAFGVAASTGMSGQRIAVEHGGGSSELITAGEPTLLAALEAHDFAPVSECRAGTCGECRMHLIDGEVRWLMPPEIALPDAHILPCICAAAGDLRLAVSHAEKNGPGKPALTALPRTLSCGRVG